MAVTFGVSSIVGTIAATTTMSTTGVTSQATGSLFIIWTNSRNTVQPATITDSFSNTYTLAKGVTGYNGTYLYYCIGGTGGASHVATATWAASGNNSIGFAEFKGFGAGTFDTAPTGLFFSAGGTTTTGPSLTTTVANELVISLAAFYSSNIQTITDSGAPWSIGVAASTASFYNSALSWEILPATGSTSDTYTWTTFDYLNTLSASFKPAGSSAAALAGAATDTTSAVGALASSGLAGAATTAISAHGALTTAIKLASAAANATSGTAALSSRIAVTIGQHAVAYNATTTQTTAAKTTNASGSTFVITIHSKGATSIPPTSVVDSFGNTYGLKTSNALSPVMWVGMYVCDNGTGGAGHTATVVWSATIQSGVIYFTEVIGTQVPSVDAVGNSFNSTGGTAMSGAALTTTVSNELILSLYGGDTGGSTVTDTGSGFSILDTPGSGSGASNSALSFANTSAVGTFQDSYNITAFDYASFVAVSFKPSLGANFAASATDAATAAGALSTTIKLVGSAFDAVTAASSFPYAALTGVAVDAVTAAAAITNSALLAAAAANTVAAAATLTNYASVVLADPLYTGIGGVLDPNFWLDNVPVSGDTLYYDPTYITIATNGEISSTTNNCSAVVQFNDGTGWALGLIVITPAMVGYATDSTTGAGLLNSVLGLASAALSATTGAAALSTGIQLIGAATDTTSALGTLGFKLQAAANTTTAALGTLTTAIKLLSVAVTTTSASGTLPNASAALVGHAIDTTAASALLTAQISVGGAAADLTTALAALSTQVYLSSAALSLTSGAATINGTPAALIGNASTVTTAMASLVTHTLLSGAATDLTTAAADISLQTQLLAAALDVSLGAGQLGTNNATARENILVYLTSQLRSVTGLLVYRTREAAVSRQEGPVLVLQPNEEAVTKLANGLVKRDLSVTITLIIRGNIPDTTADPFLQLIQVAIFTDTTLGGLAALCLEKSNRWETEIADVTALIVDSDYVVTYMTNTNTVALVH